MHLYMYRNWLRTNVKATVLHFITWLRKFFLVRQFITGFLHCDGLSFASVGQLRIYEVAVDGTWKFCKFDMEKTYG